MGSVPNNFTYTGGVNNVYLIFLEGVTLSQLESTGGVAYSDITYSDIADIVIILFGPGPILFNMDRL